MTLSDHIGRIGLIAAMAGLLLVAGSGVTNAMFSEGYASHVGDE